MQWGQGATALDSGPGLRVSAREKEPRSEEGQGSDKMISAQQEKSTDRAGKSHKK